MKRHNRMKVIIYCRLWNSIKESTDFNQILFWCSFRKDHYHNSKKEMPTGSDGLRDLDLWGAALTTNNNTKRRWSRKGRRRREETHLAHYASCDRNYLSYANNTHHPSPCGFILPSSSAQSSSTTSWPGEGTLLAGHLHKFNLSKALTPLSPSAACLWW